MKKTIICNVPMKKDVEQTVYVSEDKALPVTDKPVRYCINAFLEKTMQAEDDIHVLLLAKKDEYSFWEENVRLFEDELNEVNADIGARVSYTVIDTAFSQERTVYEQLMTRIVDEIEVGTHVLADITYGPKDAAIIVFAAMQFAEDFLDCDIDNIVYGQADFVDGKVVNTKICDMIPLYSFSAVTKWMRCVEPEKAKQLLKSLLSI